LKDTSLAFSIGVMDMVGRGQTLISSTSHALEVYISLSIVYYVIVILLEKGFAITERRLQRHERKRVISKPALRTAERLKRIAG
jgi:L-cystine transport system permease protein